MRQLHKQTCTSGITACPLVSWQDHDYLNSRKRGISKRLARDLPLVKLLNISITLSPFLGVDTMQFHASLTDGTEDYWLSLPSAPQGQLVRCGCGGLSVLCLLLGCTCDKVLLTNPQYHLNTPWFVDPPDEPLARNVLREAEHHQPWGSQLVPGESGFSAGSFGDGVHHAGGGRRESFWGASSATAGGSQRGQVHQPAGGRGHKDGRLHHCDGGNTVTPQASLLGCICCHILYLTSTLPCLRSSHKPLFVRMTPLQSDWSPMGLKGIIPSLLHHTLLGYNFLIPDAVGNAPLV